MVYEPDWYQIKLKLFESINIFNFKERIDEVFIHIENWVSDVVRSDKENKQKITDLEYRILELETFIRNTENLTPVTIAQWKMDKEKQTNYDPDDCVGG